MKCSSCNQELNFPEEVLKKITSCPFCGTVITQEKKIDKPLVPIEIELQKIVDDFGGFEIFSEENYSRLNKALLSMPGELDIEKNRLLVANIAKIPQKMYSVIERPQNEQYEIVKSCISELADLGLSNDICNKVVSLIAKVLNIYFEPEKKQKIVKKTSEMVYKSDNSNERVYKTCIIGKKVWFAENFDEYFARQSDGVVRCKPSKNVNGIDVKCYTRDQAITNAPLGWRLPSIEDFKEMIDYIKTSGLNSATAVKAVNMWSGKAESGRDVFGFNAVPTAYNNGSARAFFWTSSLSDNPKEPYSIVAISADSNDILTNYYGDNNVGSVAVRYVQDYDEKQWVDLNGNQINLYEWVDGLSEMFRDDSIEESTQKKLTFATMVVKFLKEKLELSDELAEKWSSDIMKELGVSEDEVAEAGSVTEQIPNRSTPNGGFASEMEEHTKKLADLLGSLGIDSF